MSLPAKELNRFKIIHGNHQQEQMFDSEPDIIPVARAAELVHVSVKTLRRLIAAGGFPGFTIGRQYFVSKPALIEYVQGGSNRG